MGISVRAVAVMGATAMGKSAFALSTAERVGGEIVSMDSRQVYRGFDVGTGKVSRAERARVPHHLLDVAEPAETWSAGRHAVLAERALREVAARGGVPILVGGTGLYFRALFGGLVGVTIPGDEHARIRATLAPLDTGALYARLRDEDPVRARELSPNDRVRIMRALELLAYTGVAASALYARQAAPPGDVAYLKLVLSLPRALARERIAQRTRLLFEAGWPAEVEALLRAGVPAVAPAMNSLGYRAIAGSLQRGEDPASCLDAVVRETQRYAKRQETFFRSEADAIWIDVAARDWQSDALGRIERFLARDARSRGAQ